MYIYTAVPLNNPKILKAKSLLEMKTTGVLLDLEDGVIDTKKDEARAMLVDAVLTYQQHYSHVIVRPNLDMEIFHKDLEPLFKAGLQNSVSITTSKPDLSQRSIDQWSFIRDNFKSEKGHALVVETPSSLLHFSKLLDLFKDIISVAFFGTEDLSYEMGVPNEPEFMKGYAEQFLLTCKAYGVIGCGMPGRFLDFKDKEKYKSLCELSVKMGFDGGMAVNPAGVMPYHEAYKLDEEKAKLYEEVFEFASKFKQSMFTFKGRVYGPPEFKRMQDELKRASLQLM